MLLIKLSMVKALIVCTSLLLALSSCHKVTHNIILKGEFHLNAFEINGGSTNFMGGVLPNYSENGTVIGDYVIYMLDNGLMRGEYYSNGNLEYYRTGIWDMPTSDSIYMNIDVFVDGTFFIEPINANEMIMSSDKNNISFFGIGEVKSVMRISNGESADPNNTKP
jgi:hypothetical protein